MALVAMAALSYPAIPRQHYNPFARREKSQEEWERDEARRRAAEAETIAKAQAKRERKAARKANLQQKCASSSSAPQA